MVCDADVVEVPLTYDELGLVRDMAEQAAVGGISRVRGPLGREEALDEDQLVGQLGECALSLYWMGSLDPYKQHREACNAAPHEGDCGVDLPGTNLDVKTSRMRYGEHALRYHLPVRPDARHPGHVYLLALVPDVLDVRVGEKLVVLLVGWICDDMLPAAPCRHGVFAGAHVVPARELLPLLPVRWRVR